jgi:legumain
MAHALVVELKLVHHSCVDPFLNTNAVVDDDAGEGNSGTGMPALLTQLLMSRPLPGREGKPLVESWECLRGAVATYTRVCGPMDQYAMKHTRLFANLCNAGLRGDSASEADISEVLEAALLTANACPDGTESARITPATVTSL